MTRQIKNTLLHGTTIILILMVIGAGIGATKWVEQEHHFMLEKSLRTALNSAQQGVHLLYRNHQAPTLVWSRDVRVREAVKNLLKVPKDKTQLLASPEQTQLRELFAPYLNIYSQSGFFIIDSKGTSLASMRDINVGTPNLLLKQQGFFERVWQGETLMSLPLESDVPLEDRHGHMVEKLATMFSAAPIEDETGRTIAVLAIRISPDESFGPVFEHARFGESGETYALNAQGVLLSESRFNESLAEMGLIEDSHHADLQLEARDPGGDLTAGFKPTMQRDQQSFTHMAQSILQGKSGIDLTGYRDYRGIPVVGAWVWDQELGFGIATEINQSEANEELARTKIMIVSAVSLLVLVMMGTWYLSVAARREVARNAELARVAAEKGKAEADIANKAKSEFLSSMSHELRTPLNAIIGFSQLLEIMTPSLSDKQMEYVRDIHKSGGHLLALINDVLDLAKIEAGKINISVEPILAHEVFSACVDLIEPQAAKQGLVLEDRTIADGTMVKADQLRLRQCLLNFMSNAVKYNRPGGRIVLSTEKTGLGYLRIMVSDTGIGISEKYLTKLFEPFNRLGAEATDVEGTGIGLSLTKSLVKEMGGKIGYSSIEGEGSTFWIDLPLVSSAKTKQAKVGTGDSVAPAVTMPAFEKPLMVLYVEDNLTNVRVMEGIFEATPNFKLITAQTAELGIELAQKNQPDIILMDGNLPHMHGNEAVRRLKSEPATKNIPVIGISANAMERDVQMALDSGCQAYLTKPINVQDLLTTMQKALHPVLH